MVNPLDRDETPARGRSGGLRDIEGIAIESGLPANLLLAVAENAPDAEGAVAEARRMATEYSPRIRAGEDITSILRAEAPDRADAIIGRARQIGERLYPEQMRAAREAAERAAQERRANEPGPLGDLRRSLTASAVEGVGSVAEGAGVLADQPLSLLRDDETYVPGALARGGAAVGDAARRMAEGLRGSMSEDSRQAMADSTPDGDLFSPSTWTMGDDPSARGYLMHAASVLGSLVPVIATGVAGRVAAVGGRATAMAAGAVGGAQAAGDGAGTAAGLIEEAFQRRGEDGRSELEAASPLFQELRAQGRSEEEAFAAVRDEAARFGAMLQAPIGAVSGSFMGAAARGLNPVINRMPGGPLSRAMRAGLATAFEEGASEAAEGAAARFGAQAASGMDVDLTEGTFGDFVLGAMGGGPVGAIAGAAPGAERRAGGGDDDERGTGSGVVVSPEPAAPGGSGEGVASTPIAEPAAGRDEQRLARVRVQLRGERQAWDGEIIGEVGDVVQIRAADGQIYEVPRAEIESGDVILTALEGGGPPPARVDTPPPPAADRPAGIGGEPEAEQADSQPMTTDDARRLLDAIEARARRQGWDDEMTAAAAQLKDAIERGTPADPSLAQSTVTQIGRSDGSPFPDEASARRALGELGISAGGYDVVLTEGGYVARPKLDLRDGGTRPLAIDDGGASRRARIGAEPVIRDGGDDPARQPALPDDRGGVPDAAAPGEPAAALNVQQNEQPEPQETVPAAPEPAPEAPRVAEAQPVVENIRSNAAVLRGVPQDAPPSIPGVSLKWDDREAGFTFNRKHVDAVRAAVGVNQSPVASVAENTAPQVDIPLPPPAADVAPAPAVAAAAAQTDPDPTPARAEAENYRTGKADWNGLTLSVENAKGSTRRGTSPDGTDWSVVMPAHYGRILGTKGADGDHVDFYMGDDETSDFALIVNQIDPATGSFDEHKIILGAKDRAEAMRIYESGFSDGSGPRRAGSTSEHTVDGIKAWLADGDMTKPTQPTQPVKAPGRKQERELSSPEPAPAAEANTPDHSPARADEARQAKPRTTKAQREREAHLDRLAEYFAPGNIVRTYGGGHDRVIGFDRGKDGDWSATVQAVSRKGDAWVDAPNERPRTHRTEPEARDLRAGPVLVADAQAQAQEDAGPETDSGVEMYSRAPRGWGEVDADPEPTAEDMKAIARDVTAEMRQHGLDGKIKVEVVRDIHQRAYGVYTRTSGLIRVKAASDLDTVGVLRHEIIHALRDSTLWGREHGLFSKLEWQGLVRAARADKPLMERIEASYPDLRTAGKMEEAVAEMYRLWATRRDQRSGVDRAFQKVRAFFAAMANALRGRGLQSAALTMERIASGRIGDRGPEGGTARDAALSRFGEEPAVAESRIAARRPDGRFSSRAAEYSAKLLGGGAITGATERGIIGQMLTDAMVGTQSGYSILALVPGEPLYAELAKNIPSAQTYLAEKHAMSAMRNERQAVAAEMSSQWRKFRSKNPKQNDALMDLMHEATIAGLDPAKPFTVRKKRTGETATEYEAFAEGRRREHAALVEKWDKLPKGAQAIYIQARDAFSEAAKTERDIIEQNITEAMEINLKRARQAYEDELTRIDEDGLEGDERMEAEEAAAEAYAAVKKRDGYGRASRLRSLRLLMEQGRVDAPYFPLLRHGQYFVTVKDANGKVVSFTKTESSGAQQEAVREAEKEFPGHDISVGVMGVSDAAPEVDPMFVADVERLIGAKVEDPSVMDSIWQRYLESLPDFSIRKSHMHRKGTPGYSKDAFRSFARQMFHSAHQLARLKHGMKMQMALEDAGREARRADDPVRAGAVVNEIARRHRWVMNPKSSAWSSWATSAAFAYYLGFTPAAAMVNLSQTVIVGIPMMSVAFKKGGVSRASRELMRAMRDFTKGKGRSAQSAGLTEDERSAMLRGYSSGVVDKSQSHDLAGDAEEWSKYADVRQRAMAPISFMFHHAERLNREITFLASYRMARADGMDHEAAITKAGRLTWDIHMNYEADSRPRLIHNDVLRVAFVFRNFQLNMIYRLFRDAHQTFNGKTPEDRRQARAQLLGITGMMMLSAGVTGTWGYGLMMALAGMFAPGADSDDLEKEIREALVNTLGRDVAGLILNGVPGHLTGIDLTSRLGMPDLWFRSPDRQLEGQDLYLFWLEQLVGAVPGIAANMFRGVDLAADGDIWRGAETAAPKAIRDLMRGWRYSQEGVTTIRGDSIIESMSPMDALTQAIGFTPAQVAEQYDRNRWMRNENEQISRARRSVFNAIAEDLEAHGRMQAATQEMLDRFNRDHPYERIRADDIRASLRQRARRESQTIDGVYLTRRRDATIRANAPVSIYGAAP